MSSIGTKILRAESLLARGLVADAFGTGVDFLVDGHLVSLSLYRPAGCCSCGRHRCEHEPA